VAIIKKGDAVDPESAERELPLARALAVVRKGDEIIGIGAIKRLRRGYASMVSERSGKEFPSQTPELGYVAIHPDHRGNKLSLRITDALLSGNNGGTIFATTSSRRMKATLGRSGFTHEGSEWEGDSGLLSLWLKT
jgi:hypothetical protein